MADDDQIDSVRTAGFIESLDQGFSAFLAINLTQWGVDPQSREGAAITISLAGLIAGRAEWTVQGDQAATTLYDSQRSTGRQMAEHFAATKKGMTH